MKSSTAFRSFNKSLESFIVSCQVAIDHVVTLRQFYSRRDSGTRQRPPPANRHSLRVIFISLLRRSTRKALKSAGRPGYGELTVRSQYDPTNRSTYQRR